jgi:hypothetical protein
MPSLPTSSTKLVNRCCRELNYAVRMRIGDNILDKTYTPAKKICR